MSNQNYQMRCKNCNQLFHTVSNCNMPIKSMGIACIRPDTNQILLIRRKHSIDFIDFLRGEYYDIPTGRVKNVNLLTEQFRKMTHEEHKILTNVKNYATLCNYANIYMHPNRLHNTHYISAADIFNKISTGIRFSINQQCNSFRQISQVVQVSQGQSIRYNVVYKNILTLDSLLLNNPSEFEFPENSVPKGRCELNETNIDAALREFEEETGINRNAIEIKLNSSGYPISLSETYRGSNNRLYHTTIFIARLTDTSTISNIDNHICDEIGHIGWYNLQDAKAAIRPYHHRRIELIDQIYKIIS